MDDNTSRSITLSRSDVSMDGRPILPRQDASMDLGSISGSEGDDGKDTDAVRETHGRSDSALCGLPPWPGAVVSTCRNGVNTGRRYWSVSGPDEKFIHFRWIDPALDVNKLAAEVNKLKESYKLLKAENDYLRKILFLNKD